MRYAPRLRRQAGSLAAAALLIGFMGQARADATLTMNAAMPRTSAFFVGVLQPWKEAVERESNGHIKIYTPSASLAPLPRQWEMVTSGIADVAITPNDFIREKVKLPFLAEIPFLAPNSVADSVAIWRTQEKYFAPANEYKDVKLLALWVNGGNTVQTLRKPVTAIDDFKGLKLWVPTPNLRQAIAAFGGTPVAAEQASGPFDYMSGGIVDGAVTGVASLISYQLSHYTRQITYFSGQLGYNLYTFFMSKKKYDGLSPDAHALTDLNAAVAAEPNNVDAILNRAAALRGLGDKDGAIVDFGTVARLRPNDAIAYYERANTYRDKGDTARSIADYNTAIRLRPDYVDAFNDRGLTYQLSGQYPKALGDFETAIRLAPNDPDAYFNRAKLYRNLGQYDDAIADYNLLISLSPRFPPAYNGRAYANFHAGRFDAAANDFGRSLVLAPAQPYPVLWLHLARLRTHRLDAEEFAANVKAIAGTGWPAPIAVYLTHSITSAALLTAAARGDSATRSDRLCDANFFLGEEALAKNQKATARRFFLEGKRRCMNASPSYTGAVAELKHR